MKASGRIMVIALCVLATGLPVLHAGESALARQRHREHQAKLRKAAMEGKLKRWVIPSLDFRDATIKEVIDQLIRASREVDPDGNGVNIILKLDPPKTSDAGLAMTVSNEDQSYRPSDRITLNLRYVSLMEALRYICDVADLEYRIDQNVVMIYRQGHSPKKIETRIYHVHPSILDAIRKEIGEEDDRRFRHDFFK